MSVSISVTGSRGFFPIGLIGCVAILSGFVALAIFGPLLVGDPLAISPSERLAFSSAEHWFGTDFLGRDVFTRAVYGAQRSLQVGFAVAVIASVLGLFLGVLTGYFRPVERVIVPVLDGMMAIPGILLAIALVSVIGANIATVIIAITIPEIPRMARIVRSVVLSVREQQFVSAAISIGTPTPMLLWRHIVPNTVGAVTVQATYTCASAIITEAVLSFLGVGGSVNPSWGGMIAESRQYIQLAPWLIAYPGILLSVLIIIINVLGDDLRERLDPRSARSSL